MMAGDDEEEEYKDTAAGAAGAAGAGRGGGWSRVFQACQEALAGSASGLHSMSTQCVDQDLEIQMRIPPSFPHKCGKGGDSREKARPGAPHPALRPAAAPRRFSPESLLIEICRLRLSEATSLLREATSSFGYTVIQAMDEA